MKKLRTPTTTFRITVSSLLTAAAAIPVGIWVNLVSAALQPGSQLPIVVRSLGWGNIYLGARIALVIGNLYAQYRWDTQDADFQRHQNMMRSRRDLRVQLQILGTCCKALERPLEVPVSARLFSIRKEKKNKKSYEHRMYQVRDAFVEKESFPHESGFTYISMTNEAFVTVRAFRARAPKFEMLPMDHSKLYNERERRMVEPTQRWSLCCPILQLDEQGQVREELEPIGMLVFYGKTAPKMEVGDTELALAICRDTAELFSTVATPIAAT